jgi:hypothetical protein
VDPSTAASATSTRFGRLITLTLDQRPVLCRVVGVAERFPTISGQFAVADVAAVQRLIDLGQPGAGQPTQVWSDQPGQIGPGLAAIHQADVLSQLTSDPVAGGILTVLGLLALLGTVLAALGLAGFVVAEVADYSPELAAWEADGMTPQQVWRTVLYRSWAVALPGSVAGGLIGVSATGILARWVALSAAAQAAVPPLTSGVGWLSVAGFLAGAIGAALAFAALISALASRRAVAGPWPNKAWGAVR